MAGGHRPLYTPVLGFPAFEKRAHITKWETYTFFFKRTQSGQGRGPGLTSSPLPPHPLPRGWALTVPQDTGSGLPRLQPQGPGPGSGGQVALLPDQNRRWQDGCAPPPQVGSTPPQRPASPRAPGRLIISLRNSQKGLTRGISQTRRQTDRHLRQLPPLSADVCPGVAVLRANRRTAQPRGVLRGEPPTPGLAGAGSGSASAVCVWIARCLQPSSRSSRRRRGSRGGGVGEGRRR